MFGQNQNPFGAGAGAPGQSSASTGTASSGFGTQPNPFAANTQQSNPSNPFAANTFGSSTTDAFNSQTMPSSNPVFGANPSQSGALFGAAGGSNPAIFGNTAASNPAFGGSNVPVTSSGNTPRFGGENTVVFGGQPSAVGGFTTSSTFRTLSPNLFSAATQSSGGVTSSSSIFQPSNSAVFGGQHSAVGGFSETTSSTFATSSANLFSTAVQSSAASTVSKTPASTTNLFAQHEAQPSSNLFAQSTGETKNQDQAAGLFGKPFVPTSSSATFGGPQQNQPQESRPSTEVLFGKPVTSSAPIFGKPAETKQDPSLFGKPATTTSSAVGLFGKAAQSTSTRVPTSSISTTLFHHRPDNSGDSTEKGSDTEKRAPLFGKAAIGDGSSKPQQQDGRSLFGKAITATAENKGEKKSITRPAPGAATTTAAGLFGKGKQQSPGDAPSQRASVEQQIGSKVVLKCSQIPAEFNNRNFLKQHFSQFGNVTKVLINITKQAATVHFKTHEEALNAKKLGKRLPDGSTINMLWGAHTPGLTRQNSAAAKSARLAPRSLGTFQGKPTGTAAAGASSSDLQDELSSMAGTTDTDDVRLLRRPDERGGGGHPRRSPSPTPNAATLPYRNRARAVSPKPVQEAPAASSSTSGPRSMRELSNSMAHSAGERYQLLNEMDKLIRQALYPDGSKKHKHMETAQVLRGTCQDMCPEKERYVREDRRRLNFRYEVLPDTDGRCDHRRTVKEYSRSSADQDVPLPHELRPGPVLMTTMNYLMNNIMDDGRDGNWADWYEFLWSRTRGIRKDITQQQLCDLAAVHLVETSARWHIYCAHRLCTEDMMTFDSKINNENLTKCLQTLKELYHDLAKKQVVCPNEAEFRAYLVLMNLNEGDILRETQELRQDLRESSAVQFVIKVFYALNSNNYASFFKLVKKGTFLNACIMHRYFGQVRSKALWIMLKAYYVKVKFPLGDLVRLFALEDEAEASEFCSHHNLTVQDGCVQLDKNAFIEPEAALPISRARKVIESKQGGTVGEVVNGGPLPPNVIPEPVSSFDEAGRLIDTTLPTSLPSPEAPAVRAPAAPRRQPTPPPPAQPQQAREVAAGPVGARARAEAEEEEKQRQIVVSNEIIKDLARDLCKEVITEMSHNMVGGLVRAAKWYLDQAAGIAGEVLGADLPENIRSVVSSAVTECQQEKAEHDAREKAEQARAKDLAVQSLTQELLAETVIEQCREEAKQEHGNVQKQLRTECRSRTSVSVHVELMEEVLTEQVRDVCRQVHRTDVVQRLQQLEHTERAVRVLVAGRFFRKWKNRYAARIRLKGSMLNFPSAPSLDTPAEQLAHLFPQSEGMQGDDFHLGRGARLTLLAPEQIEEERTRLEYSIAAHKLLNKLRHDQAYSAIDVCSLVHDKLTRRSHQQQKMEGASKLDKGVSSKQYMKLLLSLPEEEDDTPEVSVLTDWMKAKFRKGTTPNPEIQGKTEVLSVYTSRAGGSGSLSVCVRAVTGHLSSSDHAVLRQKHCLHGTSALLFVLSPLTAEQNLWRFERERLESLVSSLPARQNIPLAVLSTESNPRLSVLLGLDLLVEEQKIADYNIVLTTENVMDMDAEKSVCESLTWLADHCPLPPKLNSVRVKDFIEDALCVEFSNRVYQDLSTRKKKGQLDQSPELLVSLYNSMLVHISQQASHPDLEQLSWPVSEFVTSSTDLPYPDWNSPDHLALLHQTILDLSLPEFCHEDSESDSWDVARINVEQYLGAVIEAGEDSDVMTDHGVAPLFSRVSCLIGRAERGFEDTCWWLSRLDDCRPAYVNMPWTEIIQACVSYKLGGIQETDELGEDITVHTLSASAFMPPVEWIQATERKTKTDVASLQDTVHLSTLKRKQEKDHYHRRSKTCKTTAQEKVQLEPENPDYVKAKEISHDLQTSMHEEAKKSREFEDYLQRVLDEGDSKTLVDNSSFYDQPLPIALVTTFTEKKEKSQQFSSPLSFFTTPKTALNKRKRFRESDVLDFEIQRKKSGSLSEEFDVLNQTLDACKTEDKLYEMRLQSLMADSF